jgi:glyoxylase-like metal-dependent hydrolase (beta-lactamase superfamily II)
MMGMLKSPRDMQSVEVDGYAVEIVVQGYPGKTVCHGGLGWSTIALIRGHGRVALVDTGGFGVRKLLIERLAQRGLNPGDVSDLLLTHAHYDHMVNWTLFSGARMIIGAEEMEWAIDEPWGETPVPELYVRELNQWPTLHAAHDGEEIWPGLTAHAAPGHTPGHLIYRLHGTSRDIIFTGDAAKNRAELLCGRADMTYDAAVSAASIEKIRELWGRKPGTILVPGHDIPMVQNGGKPEYLGAREATIRAWFGDDLEQTTTFELTV